jgi:hypothetical protein
MNRWEQYAEAVALAVFAFAGGVITMLWLAEPYHGF